MTPEIACLGLLVADTVGRPIDRLPARGTLELIERIELHIGGCAANTGASLAKLGIPVAVLGKVGADGFGEYLLHALRQVGADVRGVRQATDVPTAATIVTVHQDAERSFLHVAGANAAFTADDVDWEAVGSARLFHVAGLQLMTAFEGNGVAQALKEARQRGMTTTLDTVMNPRSAGWAGLAPALPYLDWALPSHEEAIQLTGAHDPAEQAARFRDGGAQNVAIKLGGGGCYVAPATGEPFTAPAFTVPAIDALGAGDAWVAGFLTGLLKGWTLPNTARLANAVGACCVQALGATTGIRSLAETEAWMRTQMGH
ncbi:MAG: sugar kinase [Armatimonadaceae bacterium]